MYVFTLTSSLRFDYYQILLINAFSTVCNNVCDLILKQPDGARFLSNYYIILLSRIFIFRSHLLTSCYKNKLHIQRENNCFTIGRFLLFSFYANLVKIILCSFDHAGEIYQFKGYLFIQSFFQMTANLI